MLEVRGLNAFYGDKPGKVVEIAVLSIGIFSIAITGTGRSRR